MNDLPPVPNGYRTLEAFKAATEEGGARGAIAGAAAGVGGLGLAATVGLAVLTPPTALAMAIVGGLAGGTGALRWMRRQLS